MSELGRLLGYPECCIDFYINAVTMVPKIPYVVNTLLNTRGKPSFYTNNIFNSESRGSRYNPEFVRNKKLLNHANHYLIPHVPCSYNCKESIVIGRTSLRLLRKEIPDFASEIVRDLKRIFLIFGDFEYSIFDGEIGGKEIRYVSSSVINTFNANPFEEGNRIIMEGSDILIFRNETHLNTIRRINESHGLLLDFT